MQISTVQLNNRDLVWEDQGARSVSFFCRQKPVRMDSALIRELKTISEQRGGKNIRLCLHEGPESLFHEMIILERKGTYYQPHKHISKGESYHLIEGSMAAFVFNEQGKILDACPLTMDGNFVYRVGQNMFHTVMPLTDLVIYHESKPGPFSRGEDIRMAAWAPDGADREKAADYSAGLIKALGQYR